MAMLLDRAIDAEAVTEDCFTCRNAGNAEKQKSLHALGLAPAAAMLDRTALTAKPPDATGSPYEAAAERRKRAASETHDQQLGVDAAYDSSVCTVIAGAVLPREAGV